MSPNGGTVTSADGLISEEVEAGKQKVIFGTGASLELSDDAGEIVATFKLAPVKLRLLGLLGGGATDALPSGYLAAEFLESTGKEYIDTGYKTNREFGAYFDVQEVTVPSGNVYYCGAQVSGNALWLESRERLAIRNGAGGYGAFWLEETKSEKNRVQAVANLYNDRLYGKVGEAKKHDAVPTQNLSFTLFRAHYAREGNFDPTAPLRMFAFKMTTGTELKLDFVPCVDTNGVPCMFDKVTKQVFKNKGTGEFIVGLTLAQARKLGKLPSGGGTLKVSLPSNYLENEGVVNAIAEANAKCWNIEVASTWDASAASATFALRRIWVRKTQDEQGNYVAADGTRWAVESCVAMYNVDGSEPDAHGYEPFRSVDAAVAYWELQPYVNPDKELLTVQ